MKRFISLFFAVIFLGIMNPVSAQTVLITDDASFSTASTVLTPINGAQNKQVINSFPVINQLPYSRRYCMARTCKGQVNARLNAQSSPTGTLDRTLSIQCKSF